LTPCPRPHWHRQQHNLRRQQLAFTVALLHCLFHIFRHTARLSAIRACLNAVGAGTPSDGLLQCVQLRHIGFAWGKGSQVIQQIADALVNQAIENVQSLPLIGHQPCIAQHAQLLRIVPLSNNRPALLVHIQRQGVEPTDALTAGTTSLPAAEDLHAWPGTCRRPGRPVGIGSTSLDVLEEPLDLPFVLAKEASSQAIVGHDQYAGHAGRRYVEIRQQNGGCGGFR
jgi:hypothetical protein